MDDARQVREFWFGTLPLSAQSLARRVPFWFGADAPPELRQQTDDRVRARFGELVERAGRGELAAWADSPRRCLSLILLLDQFPRMIHRGTAQAYAFDPQALALTLSGMQSAADGALDIVARIFFYLPLQHAENLEVQHESVAAYRRLVTEASEDLRPTFEDSLKCAQEHLAIIERFGRFPHRNRLLKRGSTPEEAQWLRETQERFGQ